MTFDSASAKKAQAKRKTHGTGAYLKHIQDNDPELYREIQARQVAKYGGAEGYKAEMKRRVQLRWARKRAIDEQEG